MEEYTEFAKVDYKTYTPPTTRKNNTIQKEDDIEYPETNYDDLEIKVREEETPESREKLMKCIELGEREELEKLIEMGVDVNYKDKNGHTPLIDAIQTQNLGIIEALLLGSDKIDVNQRDEVSQTPLIVACKLALNTQKSKELNMHLVKRLLDSKNINVNAKDGGGASALMFAVSGRDEVLAQLLLSRRADPNTANNAGHTPLHMAVTNKDKKIVKLLAEYGARVLPDNTGQTPLDVAHAADLAGEDIKKYLMGVSPPPMINWISTQKYRPGSRKPQLGITTIGLIDPQHQLWIERDTKILLQHKCSVLVTALSTDEISEMQLDSIFEVCKRENIESVHFPIHKWFPRLPVEDVVKLTEDLADKMRNGHVILIHTDPGQGRAGLLSAALLVQLGFSLEEAIQIIDDINPAILQNPTYHLYLGRVSGEINQKREDKILGIYDSIKISTPPQNANTVVNTDPSLLQYADRVTPIPYAETMAVPFI